MLQQWYPLYQSRIDMAIARIFDERYSSAASDIE